MTSPMHVVLSPSGQVLSLGRTIKRLLPEHAAHCDREFLDLFEVKKPRNIETFSDLSAYFGTRLHLHLRHVSSHIRLKGILVSSETRGVVILQMSFGFSLIEAVREFQLSASDFSVTDSVIEMLYLFEAKSAAIQESQMLNHQLHGAKVAAEAQAYTDPLTGLRNRRGLEQLASRLLVDGAGFSLMHLDLDYFKQVNDEHGHAAGDAVLQHVADLMVEAVRDTDTVIRVGGDEFVILLPAPHNRKVLSRIADRINARLCQPLIYEGKSCRIAVSIGIVSSMSYLNPSLETMMADADSALYMAKRRGRAQSAFHAPH